MNTERTKREKEVKRKIRKVVAESKAAYLKAREEDKSLLSERLFGETIIRLLYLDSRKLVVLKKQPFFNEKTAKEYAVLKEACFEPIWPMLMLFTEVYHKTQERSKEKYAAILTREATSRMELFYSSKLQVLELEPFFSEWVAREYVARGGRLVTQREVAEHFCVTEADISKMVKRIRKICDKSLKEYI